MTAEDAAYAQWQAERGEADALAHAHAAEGVSIREYEEAAIREQELRAEVESLIRAVYSGLHIRPRPFLGPWLMTCHACSTSITANDEPAAWAKWRRHRLTEGHVQSVAEMGWTW